MCSLNYCSDKNKDKMLNLKHTLDTIHMITILYFSVFRFFFTRPAFNITENKIEK